MPTISRSALVMHSAKEMYQLINDVLSYPQFLPDCGDSKVISQSDTAMTAAILIKKGGISKWFTTENTLIENEQVILNLVDGPFKSLKGSWLFTPLSDKACKIHFELEYEFSNTLLALTLGSVFTHLTNNIVQAFTKRAKEVYVSHV